MSAGLSATELETLGVAPQQAVELAARVASLWPERDPARRWSALAREVLSPQVPFAVHRALFARNYADWDILRGPAPAWCPSEDDVAQSNLKQLMDRVGVQSVEQFAAWAIEDPGRFWLTIVDALEISFETPPRAGVDWSLGRERPQWLPGARLNIGLSCFATSADRPALVASNEAGRTRSLTAAELRSLCLQFAGALRRRGIQPGDRVALVLPLTLEAVVAYLGVVLSGAAAVCIADSFAATEVERRIRIADARLVITQDVIVRSGKTLPLYEKLRTPSAPPMVVVAADESSAAVLRDQDGTWEDFLSAVRPAEPTIGDAQNTMTVLFSSGTTADPKAIPWPHTTPIKCVADGFLYQDIRPGDVVTWPTSMGWMMGPWLIFAGLINRATVALFDGHPASSQYVEFVERTGVTVMGVIPSLVTAWNASGVWDRADWSRVRLLSSTGECSEPDQMLALMARCGYSPVIEYCGGTEIGGGYLASSVLRPIAPSYFNQAVLGFGLHLFDQEGRPAKRGEVYLSGAAMGLSTELLNGDHHATYHAGAPRDATGELLRRHGDQIETLAHGYYRVLGRADDAMNLGGIKVAAVEIEQVLNRHPHVAATAAVAVSEEKGGPGKLVVFAVAKDSRRDTSTIQHELQTLLRNELNPLFQIWRLEWIESLPITASNKVMRRLLRDRIKTPAT